MALQPGVGNGLHLRRDQVASSAFNVIGARMALDSGQLTLAFSASSRKRSLVAPGTFASEA